MRIYVELLDERTQCWLPVEAEGGGLSAFEVLTQRPVNETRPLEAGDVVSRIDRKFADGTALPIACSLFAEQDDSNGERRSSR